jgi:threonine synthase
MVDLNAEIRRVPGDYEKAVGASQAFAGEKDAYDANPGGRNTMLQLRAYGEIAYEIYDELRDAPVVVAAPVSNGTTLAGLHKGFLSLYRRGKTSRMPRVVAGSSFRKNPIVRSFVQGHATCEDLKPQTIRETPINEPLINWHSIDGDVALRAVRETGGWAGYASDREMRRLSRLLSEKEGLQVLPASTAGLIALIERHRKEPLSNDRFVVLLTGRKS